MSLCTLCTLCSSFWIVQHIAVTTHKLEINRHHQLHWSSSTWCPLYPGSSQHKELHTSFCYWSTRLNMKNSVQCACPARACSYSSWDTHLWMHVDFRCSVSIFGGIQCSRPIVNWLQIMVAYPVLLLSWNL